VIEKFTRCAIAGNTVAKHASEFVMLVENRAGDPLAAQLVRGRETGRSAADDGDLVLADCGHIAELESLVLGGIANVLLDRVDADEIVDVVAVTALFAGSGADASHHRWERVGIGGAQEGVFLHTNALGRQFDTTHDIKPAADVLARRAAALAGRGAMHVGWAFVRGIFVKNILALRTPAMHTVLVFPEREFLVHFLF
jgi:hypothetical protein